MKILGNIIWLIFGGIIVALQYFISSIGLFITIIGIPFGLQTIKLGLLALWPFGSEIIHKESPHGCFFILGGYIGMRLSEKVLFAITSNER